MDDIKLLSESIIKIETVKEEPGYISDDEVKCKNTVIIMLNYGGENGNGDGVGDDIFKKRNDLLFPDKEEPPENELLSSGVVARQQRNDNKSLEIQEMPEQKSMHIKLFKCLVCKKSVSSKQALYYHMESHSGEKPFECSTCQKRFYHKQSLAIHMRKHEKPFECSVCKKRFAVKSSLKRHLLTHPDGNLFMCPVCKEGFQQKAHFREHVRTHTGGKLFECSLCKKNFTSQSSLNYHRPWHGKEDVYRCSICQERFGKKELLDEHKLIHASEKPLKCPKLVFDRILVPVSLGQ